MLSTFNDTTSTAVSRCQALCRTLPVPLIGLLTACGGQYELGEVMQELDRDNAIAADMGAVIVDAVEDADVRIPLQGITNRGFGVGDVNG